MTKFGGRKTAFHNGGAATKFKGRSGFGPMTRNVNMEISSSNRKVTKSNIGDGGGSGTRMSSRFGKK